MIAGRVAQEKIAIVPQSSAITVGQENQTTNEAMRTVLSLFWVVTIPCAAVALQASQLSVHHVLPSQQRLANVTATTVLAPRPTERSQSASPQLVPLPRNPRDLSCPKEFSMYVSRNDHVAQPLAGKLRT